MSGFRGNLLDLDVDKLFEECSLNEIIEVEKSLDAEIERKRMELRGMVGDRYKDVLAASDAIKAMKNISETIVDDIKKIGDDCGKLIDDASADYEPKKPIVSVETINERTIIMKIRLIMEVNNQVWMAIEEDDCCKAAELYMLAQHVHTDLLLLSSDYLDKLPILRRLKSDTDALKNRILKRTKEKLQAVELSPKESSTNLNALLLLEQYHSGSELFNIFIELRTTALQMVINESYASVRAQVTTMLKCLVATVHLLHECFINYESNKRGLIWQQFEDIVSDSAPTTLSKVTLPSTPLIIYIPDIIKQFKPKGHAELSQKIIDIPSTIQKWLNDTSDSIKQSLQTSLNSITNIKGLHMIREEALKVALSPNWEVICNESYLPNNFNAWYYFCQTLITARAKTLISKKISSNLISLENSISEILNKDAMMENSESDLRWYTWKEEDSDVSRTENTHLGLTMKTKGYSPSIVKLCTQFDQKYLALLEDISLYFYGVEFNSKLRLWLPYNLKNNFNSKKHIDSAELEDFLRITCNNNSQQLTKSLQGLIQTEQDEYVLVVKSLICARFLHALVNLCHNFNVCCSCGNRSSEWDKICNHFNKSSLEFWQNWIKYCNGQVEIRASQLQNVTAINMLEILPKWENIEIQEEADEKVVKSQIRVPSHPSLYLHGLLSILSDQISAMIPHTLPKQIHLQFIETNMQILLKHYEATADKGDLNQTQALQFLFDIKFITTMSIPRENLQLVSKSQSICDKFRSKIDPFDLDVFYTYLQTNVKTCVLQSQVILGCLLPSPGQLASLGMFEKSKEHEKEPSILAVSIPATSSWFPLLPVTAPVQKLAQTSTAPQMGSKNTNLKPSESIKKSNSVNAVRSGAAAFFGAMTNDWFS